MLPGTNTEKLLLATVVFTSVTADGCGTGQDLIIGGSAETCDKEWIINREYNDGADVAMCATRCGDTADCTHFSLSTVGTCVTYRGCDTFRESNQIWDTYQTLEPCETTTEEITDVVCEDITDKWECRREGCLYTGRTCHDSSFEPECSDWETKKLCEEDTAQGCHFHQDTKKCKGTPTPTATPTATPTGTPTGTPTATPAATSTVDDATIADGVQQIAVQAGFRYKECIKNAPFGGFTKIVLTQFAPSILGDLLNFETDRRRWGFNKNNFITNIAKPLDGVACEDLHEQCTNEAERVYQEGLEDNQADVAASYPFMSGKIDYFLACAEEEIVDICTDYKNLACPTSD